MAAKTGDDSEKEPSWQPTFEQMITELATIVEWSKLNYLMIHMGVENHQMKKIKNDYAKIDDQKAEAFTFWLNNTPDARWKHIIEALRKINERTLASRLDKDYQRKEPRFKSARAYIQLVNKDQPIKVIPAGEKVSMNHLTKPPKSSKWYQVAPGNLPQPIFSPNPWIQGDIKTFLRMFLSRIDKDDSKDNFIVGYEARFGRQYYRLQDGSEDQPARSLKEYKPDLIKHDKTQFQPEIYHEISPVLDKYCDMTEDCRKIILIDPLTFIIEGQEEGMYTAFIEEVKHGVFMLKAVYYQSKNQSNSARYDIVLPNNRYDIRIADNCGRHEPVKRDSLSYQVADEITMSMKRKSGDRSQLSLKLKGETSRKESKFFVEYLRQKLQIQYRWKGEKWILTKYIVDTIPHAYDVIGFEKMYPDAVINEEHDFIFKTERQRIELELWNEMIYPKDVDKTRPTRDEYWHMQSCKTPLFLPGEGVPVPPRPWTADGLMKDFDEFLQAAFNVAECLETSDPLPSSDPLPRQ